jgi:hypothetical protein
MVVEEGNVTDGDDEDLKRNQRETVAQVPVKRDYMGLPRLDGFEVTRLPLTKIPLKSWLKLVHSAVYPNED